MLFHTHLLLGICFFFLFNNYLGNNYIIFLLVLLGAILPDIDEDNSKINKGAGVVGSVVGFLVKHRGIFHSVLFALFLFFIIDFVWGFNYGLALLVGYMSHLVGDSLTPMGIQVFYPFSKFKIRGPIRVGSTGEWIILFGLILLVVREMFF
jgi:inner membrane protein